MLLLLVFLEHALTDLRIKARVGFKAATTPSATYLTPPLSIYASLGSGPSTSRHRSSSKAPAPRLSFSVIPALRTEATCKTIGSSGPIMFGFDTTPVKKEDLSKVLYIGWVNQANVVSY